MFFLMTITSQPALTPALQKPEDFRVKASRVQL